MNKEKKALKVVSIMIIVLICIAFTHRALQNDTFYTVKIGKLILKNGIDMKDHFSWHKLDYTYPHWLYDVIIYKIYSWFKFGGLYIFNIMCFILIAITFYNINLKLNKSYFLSLLFSIFGVIMLANYVAARAQLFTYFLFVLEILFIERLLTSSKKKYAIGLFIINILIANLHAAVWPFYFILMLPFLFEWLVYEIKNKFNIEVSKKIFIDRLIIEKKDGIKILGIVFIISLFLGLLTPIGFTPYLYFIKILQGDTMKYIDEHKALVLIEDAFVWGYLLILLVPLIFTKVKVRLSDLVMIFGIILMTFMSVRHIAFLAIVGTFYLCKIYSNIGRNNSKDKVLDFDLPIYGSVIVLITVIITSGIVFNINSKESYINEEVYPVEMVEYIYDNMEPKKMKLYNEYDFGSYLLFKNLKVYIDSRSDLYTKPFNKKNDIFDECMNITVNYGRVFSKYDITHILIYKDTDLNQILTASPNYKLVHKEGKFALFEYLDDDKKEDNKKET
ncbi:MAG: hypothetical protein VZS44_06015 [Bacilli bacterium]|nr:hypothetical protein [Bacilli bacterium]